MKCDNCKNEYAYRLSYVSNGKETEKYCDRCGVLSAVINPDVYFKGPYWDENITSEKDSQSWFKGTYITSKGQKARLLKENKMFESGDRVHGARNFDKRRKYI